MTFIGMNVQLSYLMTKKSVLELKNVVDSDNEQLLLSQMQTLSSQKGFNQSDSKYLTLQAQNQALAQEMASITTQLNAINEQITSFKDAIKNNIKNDCKLNISA